MAERTTILHEATQAYDNLSKPLRSRKLMILKFEMPEKTKQKIKAFTDKLKANPDIVEIFEGDDVQIFYYKDGIQFLNCFVAGFTEQSNCFCMGRDSKAYHITKAQMQVPGLTVADVEYHLLLEGMAGHFEQDDDEFQPIERDYDEDVDED